MLLFLFTNSTATNSSGISWYNISSASLRYLEYKSMLSFFAIADWYQSSFVHCTTGFDSSFFSFLRVSIIFWISVFASSYILFVISIPAKVCLKLTKIVSGVFKLKALQ